MKKLILSTIISLSLAFITPAFAQTKTVDKDSPEHKAWVENFRKKHDIKAKPAAKKPAAKKPAKKPAAKKAV